MVPNLLLYKIGQMCEEALPKKTYYCKYWQNMTIFETFNTSHTLGMNMVGTSTGAVGIFNIKSSKLVVFNL